MKKAPNMFPIDQDLSSTKFLNSYLVHFFLHFLVDSRFLDPLTNLILNYLDPIVPNFLS